MAAITAITRAHANEMAVSGMVIFSPGSSIFGNDSINIFTRRLDVSCEKKLLRLSIIIFTPRPKIALRPRKSISQGSAGMKNGWNPAHSI